MEDAPYSSKKGVIAEAQGRYEQAKTVLYQAHEDLLQKYLEDYISGLRTRIKQKFQNLNESTRQSFLNKLEYALSNEIPIECVSGIGTDRVIDVEYADDLNEILCKAIRYMNGKLRTDQDLANWMKRSRPTAYRIRKAIEERSSLDEPPEQVGKINVVSRDCFS